MPSSRRLQIAGVSLGVLLASAWFVWAMADRYSPRSKYDGFLESTQRLLQLGLASDSAALAGLNADSSVIRWALDAGRANPARLRALLSGLEVTGGMQNGDGRVVYFHAEGFSGCETWPLRVTFSGPPAKARFVHVTAECDPK